MKLMFWVALAHLAWLALRPRTAEAHQPRVVTGGAVVEVFKPEVSQAFYASLAGAPGEYQITSDRPFPLYVSLLVPDLPGRRTDFTVEVCTRGEPARQLIRLDGNQASWRTFYEPFAGDRYYQGPERELELPAGTYIIKVTNADRAGQYVLAVGRKESFTFRETLDMLRVLPAVKRYFRKSPLAAYANLVGVFVLLVLGAVAAILAYALPRVLTTIGG